MKHIKRKFLSEISKSEFEKLSEGKNVTSIPRGEKTPPLNPKFAKNHIGHLATESGILIQSFPIKVDGKLLMIPEPDPTLIYFSSAQNNYRLSKQYRVELLPKIDVQSDISEEIIHDFYNYFSSTCGSVIFLFTSLESFMNSLIKDDYFYRKEQNNRTEIYNKKQIEQHISFDEKIKKVIPQLTGIDFLGSHPIVKQNIDNLKEFRDSIIHTKSNKDEFTYDHIVKKSFNFDYDKAIEMVAKYMNGYKSNYILECPCNADF
ncbi:MAG: hypothetical protein JNJ41_06550 [Bacteroidia bacterium]|nr:hypothetical protein [Bacteroidia bacterium]